MPAPSDELDPHTLPILRSLPASIFLALRDRLYAGVTNAEIRFPYNAADEDALTGALGHSLTEPVRVFLQTADGVFQWQMISHKLRGRGRGAPEKRIGADGIFQLEVRDETGAILVRKGLLFQSKVDWSGSDLRLLDQTVNLVQHSSSSIVIDYTAQGYRAIAAIDVITAEGDRRLVPKNKDKRLSEILGDEFAGCTRGDRGLHWDESNEQLLIHGDERSGLVPSHLISMGIQRLQPARETDLR